MVLVDHDSLVPRVKAVKQHLTESLRKKLIDAYTAAVALEEAVMQGREDKEYDFNGDLLEDWLIQKLKLVKLKLQLF